MKSLSLSEAAVTSAINTPVNRETSAPVKPQPYPKEPAGAAPEIWMRLKMGAWNMSADYYLGNYYDLSKNKMAYRVLLPDGSYTGDEIPGKDLSGFDQKSPGAGNYTWGRYTRSTAGISFKSAYEDVNLTFKTPEILESSTSSFPYYRCKKVDGLKLNGSWSYIPDSEKDSYYDEPGCRQVIMFRDDMTFDDRGAVVSDCRYPNAYPEDAPAASVPMGRLSEMRPFTRLPRPTCPESASSADVPSRLR